MSYRDEDVEKGKAVVGCFILILMLLAALTGVIFVIKGFRWALE